MMNNYKKHGFVIPLTLMLIAVAMVLITGIYQRGSIFVPFISTMMYREQAKKLALSGVQVAMSQLATAGISKDKGKKGAGKPGATDAMLRKDKDTASAGSPLVPYLSEVLPILNQWQQFKLKQLVDGVDGEIAIAISCEEGKINLNAIYDFGKKRFRGENEKNGDWKKIMQVIFGRMQKMMGISANLFEPFEKFLKERQYRVNDATELLTIDAFRAFAGKEFYQPPQKDQKKDRSLYLLDLFTTYGGSATLEPWLLSDSIRGVLDMKRVVVGDIKQRKAVIQEWFKKFKHSVNWPQEWNKIFQPIYGIEFQRLLKGIDAVFETSFDPRLFSVVSYGVVGKVTQRAYAVLERIKKTDKKKTWYDVKIKKFYWI